MRNLTTSDLPPGLTKNPLTVRTSTTYYYSTSPMAMTILIVAVILFFAISFAVFARRFFSNLHSSDIEEHRRRSPPPPPPPQNWRIGYYSPPVRTFGLDPAVVRMLPLLTYGSVGGGGVREGCVVCLSEFEEKEKVKLIPSCGHVFHPGCIDGWLVLHGSCPICRCSDVSVDLTCSSTSAKEENAEEEGEEMERKVLRMGRSRSLCCRSDDGDGEEERRVTLRRTCSV